MGARKLADDLHYPPRAMRVDDAAAYLGYSRSTFLRLVDERIMPPPVKTPDHNIATWDRIDLDAAFDDLKNSTGPVENTFDKAMRKLEDAKGNGRKAP
jgi:predicted DNA-binding transcriptional regulator AlpA